MHRVWELTGECAVHQAPVAPAVPAAAEESRLPATSGVVLCHKWMMAGALKRAFTSWRVMLITGMLMCGFCGRVSLGGTHYAEHTFQSLPAVGGAAPCTRTPSAWTA